MLSCVNEYPSVSIHLACPVGDYASVHIVSLMLIAAPQIVFVHNLLDPPYELFVVNGWVESQLY